MTLHLWQSADLPEDVDQSLWNDYIEVRKSKKFPLTEGALKLILGKMRKYGPMGYSIDAMLKASIEAGWRSIFTQGEPVQKHLSCPLNLGLKVKRPPERRVVEQPRNEEAVAEARKRLLEMTR